MYNPDPQGEQPAYRMQLPSLKKPGGEQRQLTTQPNENEIHAQTKQLLSSTQKLHLASTKNFQKPVPIIEEVTKENFFANKNKDQKIQLSSGHSVESSQHFKRRSNS